MSITNRRLFAGFCLVALLLDVVLNGSDWPRWCSFAVAVVIAAVFQGIARLQSPSREIYQLAVMFCVSVVMALVRSDHLTAEGSSAMVALAIYIFVLIPQTQT